MTKTCITGAGIVSCYGSGTETLVSKLHAGQSREKHLSNFRLQDSEYYLVNEIDRKSYNRGYAGEVQLFIQVIQQALDQANLDLPLTDCALIVGTSGFMFAAESEIRNQYDTGSTDPPSAGYGGLIVNPVVSHFGIGGPVFCVHTACASSANAMTIAHEMISRGEIRRAIVVGAEGLSAVALSGFQSLMLLDRKGCRPFDADRNGLQLGEAYGAIILESFGASDLCSGNGTLTFLGGGNICDTHHVTSASPDGSMMKTVIENAFRSAGVEPHEINYIKAHGTGSTDNDTAEAAALVQIFGKSVPPFTVVKRYLGHTLGACGVVETIALQACLQAGFFPGTAGFNKKDDALGIVPVTNTIDATTGYYLSNFFGFGGNYAAFVMHFQQ